MRSALLLASLFVTSTSYYFSCLDDCECDTTDEVIHCHSGGRTQLKLPEANRLRGYHTIALPHNNLTRLPAEDELLMRFPDLLAVDVERNPFFDCSTLGSYSNVKIISDCFHNVSDVGEVPPIIRPNSSCDLACQTARHYQKLREYVLRLWEIIRQKYSEFDADEAFAKVKTFFSDAVDKVHSSINNGLNSYHPRNRNKGREVVVPSTVAKEDS